MDVTLQRHYAKFIYVVPDGLRELISDISREVLRSQPDDLYTFIADYLDALMITRENARVASRLVAEIIQISETTADILSATGMTRELANRAANIIQRKFKEFLNFQHSKIDEHPRYPDDFVQEIIQEVAFDEEDVVDAAIIIQRAFRLFLKKREQEKELLRGRIDWRVAARSAIALYRNTGVTYHEAHRAATLIKSAYKAYYQRKFMTKLLDEMKEPDSEECLCESYSLDLPEIKSESISGDKECTCSVDSVASRLDEPDQPCYCEYTSSELIAIGKGKKIITNEGFAPLVPQDGSSDSDEYCYCEGNPSMWTELENMRDHISDRNLNEDEGELIDDNVKLIYSGKKESYMGAKEDLSERSEREESTDFTKKFEDDKDKMSGIDKENNEETN